MEELLTATRAYTELGVSYRLFMEEVNKGTIPFTPFGKGKRFTRKDIEKGLEAIKCMGLRKSAKTPKTYVCTYPSSFLMDNGIPLEKARGQRTGR